MYDVSQYDTKLFEDARALANLDNSTEIRAYFASTGTELCEGDNLYAAAFGRLQAVTHELLCTVARLQKANADA